MAMPHLIADCQGGITILTSQNMDGVAKSVARMLQHRGTPIDYEHEYVVEVETFSDGEICPTIQPNVRDKVVFLFWDFTPKDFEGHINVRITELMLTLDAIRRAKAKYVNLIIPYLPYARQDRKMKSRQPLSARVFADDLEKRGIIDQLVTFDLHAPQITGFFDKIHVENIPGHVIFAPYFRKKFAKEIEAKELSVTTTDVGGAKRARDLAEEIACDLDIGIIDKRRDKTGSEAIKYVGEVTPVMIAYDDIGGTMGSMFDACNMVKNEGAQMVYGAVTHNVCSPKGGSSAEEKIARAGIPIFTLDTLPRGASYYKEHPLIIRIPYHDFMAAAITEMTTVNGSVSRLIRSWSRMQHS